MSVSSNGSKGEPQFVSSGNTPTFAADLTAVSDYAAEVGNYVIGTTAERTAYSAWEGLQWWDTDDDLPYEYVGGAWRFSRTVTRVQANTTNNSRAALIQTGIGYIDGDNTSNIEKVVTFPTAYASLYGLTVSNLGAKTSGSFGFTSTTTAAGTNATAYDVSTTGFTMQLQTASGTLSSTLDFYFSWIAFGAT